MQLDRRRSSIEIIADMLRLGEAGKTEIMYTVKMSYYQIQKYLNWLLELGLLHKVVKENQLVSYRVTKKGLSLLVEIENMQEILQSDEALRVLHTPEQENTVREHPHRRIHIRLGKSIVEN